MTQETRPAAVDAAADWIRRHGAGYTGASLDEALRAAGYADAEILEARLRVAVGPNRPAPGPAPAGRDLRAATAAVLIVGFLLAWAVIALPLWLVEEPGGHGFAATAAVIFTVLLLGIGLPSLIWIADHGRLREGTLGVAIGALTAPFLLLVVLAGMCVSTTRDLR